MMEGPVICCPRFPRYTFLQAEACFCLGRKFRSSPRDVARNFRLNQRSWTDFSGLLQNFWILWTESISHVDFSKANSLLHFDISKKKKKEISIYDRIVNVISTCLERADNIFHREPIKRKNKKKCERVSHEISTRENSSHESRLSLPHSRGQLFNKLVVSIGDTSDNLFSEGGHRYLIHRARRAFGKCLWLPLSNKNARPERRLEKRDDLSYLCVEIGIRLRSKKSARGTRVGGKKDDWPNEIIDHRASPRYWKSVLPVGRPTISLNFYLYAERIIPLSFN